MIVCVHVYLFLYQLTCILRGNYDIEKDVNVAFLHFLRPINSIYLCIIVIVILTIKRTV